MKHRADYYRRHYDANRELYAMWKRAWYDANREVVLARQRADVEGSRAKAQRYKESHREVLAERQCRRRAAERAGVEIGEIDLDALWTGYCGICGDELDPSLTAPSLMRKSLDHIWPLALGGDHVQHNLQWSHLRCNIRKGAKPPDI